MQARCPFCRGFGTYDGRVCGACLGIGRVDPENVCECGRPAIMQAGGGLVCSSTQCFEAATKPETTNEVRGSQGLGIYGNGDWGDEMGLGFMRPGWYQKKLGGK